MATSDRTPSSSRAARRRFFNPSGARLRLESARGSARALRRRSRPGDRLHRPGGDPSDRTGRARHRAEAGCRSPRAVRHARCDAAEGRFANEADALRLYRSIATMDRAAPLPSLPDARPIGTRPRRTRVSSAFPGSRRSSRRRARGRDQPRGRAELHPVSRRIRRAGLGSRCCTSDSRTSSSDRLSPVRPSSASTIPATSTRSKGSTRTSCSIRTRLRARRRGRRHAWPPAAARPRSRPAALLSCVLPGITRCGRRQWASASSTTSPSQRATRRPSSGSSGWRSSTSTSTTETGRRPCFAATRRFRWSRCTSGPSGRSGGPGTSDEDTLNVPLEAGSGDWGTPRIRRARRADRPRVRAGPRPRVRGLRCPPRRPARGHADDRRRLRDLARRCGAMAPQVAAVLEGDDNLDTLPDLVEAAFEGLPRRRIRPEAARLRSWSRG